MVCRKCGTANWLRREERRGFLQLKVFPRFGLYPWECMECRGVRLYRKQFPGRRRPESGLAVNEPANLSSAPGDQNPTLA